MIDWWQFIFFRKNRLLLITSFCIAFAYLPNLRDVSNSYIRMNLITIFCELILFTVMFLAVTWRIKLKSIVSSLFFLIFQIYAWIAFYFLLAIDPSPFADANFQSNVALMVNLNPLQIISQFSSFPSTGYAIKQIFGNIIVLSPLCFFLLYFIQIRVKYAYLALFVCSCSIELLQFLTDLFLRQGRAADIDDVLLNTSGAAIGIAGYSLYTILSKKWMSHRMRA